MLGVDSLNFGNAKNRIHVTKCELVEPVRRPALIFRSALLEAIFFEKDLFGCVQKWWYPTTMGFPTKKTHFGVFWGYPYFWKHPFLSTLWKIDGWNLKITQLKKENHLPSTSTLGFHVDLQWCRCKSPQPAAVSWAGANILFPWFWYLHQHTREVWQLAKLTSYLSTQIWKGERLSTSSFFRGVSELKLWGREYPDRPGGSCSPNRFCSLDQTTLDCCRRGPTSAVGRGYSRKLRDLFYGKVD